MVHLNHHSLNCWSKESSRLQLLAVRSEICSMNNLFIVSKLKSTILYHSPFFDEKRASLMPKALAFAHIRRTRPSVYAKSSCLVKNSNTCFLYIVRVSTCPVGCAKINKIPLFQTNYERERIHFRVYELAKETRKDN